MHGSELKQRIYAFVVGFIEEKGYSPSVRDIAAHFNIGHSTVRKRLSRLREQGLIDYDEERARSIRTSSQIPITQRTLAELGWNVVHWNPTYKGGTYEYWTPLSQEEMITESVSVEFIGDDNYIVAVNRLPAKIVANNVKNMQQLQSLVAAFNRRKHDVRKAAR